VSGVFCPIGKLRGDEGKINVGEKQIERSFTRRTPLKRKID